MNILYIKFELEVQCPNCANKFDPNKWGTRIDLILLLTNRLFIPELTCPHCDYSFKTSEFDILEPS